MRILVLSLITVFTLQAGAHGEDKPGPNGGFISMPGSFHVEVVPVSAREIEVYLLDINWEKPTTTESSVELKHGSVSAKCVAKGDSFFCTFPRAIDLTKAGEIRVNATRAKQRGNAVKYVLPLRLEKTH